MRSPKLLGLSLALLFAINGNALTLKESVVEVLNTNPVVQERLRNYRATQQDLSIAESEYYPSLDLRAVAGYNKAGTFKDLPIYDGSYTNYESALVLTQNIFDGFSTMHKVGYQESRILAAAYNYVEVSNDIAFQMTQAYMNVIKGRELLAIEYENVNINMSIYKKIKDLYEAGLTTDSEVKKIQAFLSLARSNLTVQKNNTRDSEYTFRRILGRLPIPSQMEIPKAEIPMPESIERASMYAMEKNPSILVSNYNVKGAQELWKQQRKKYYPTVDLEVSQNFNDASEKPNGFDQADDRFRARLVLNYNLYHGGADKAEIQKNISKINQEVEVRRDLKRQVIEGLNLSWNAYEMITEQLSDLRDYKLYSDKTLELYQDEYDQGIRSLLDLMQSQSDVINARRQIVTAEYDLKFAKYRVLDAMGLMVLAVTGDSNEFASRVNLYIEGDAKEVLDTLPISFDVDDDKITDNIDQCDNSLENDNIMPDGCRKRYIDNDRDGVVDVKDACPFTPIGVTVLTNGCALDSDKDGVIDQEDQCINTPLDHKVNSKGCSISTTMIVPFAENAIDIPDAVEERIDRLALFLKREKAYKIKIIAYSDKAKGVKTNLKISKRRANALRHALMLKGVSRDRITTEGRGIEEPIVKGDTVKDFDTNQYVAFELSRGES